MVETRPGLPSLPVLIFARLQWQYHRRLLGKTGIKVVEEEWDNLIIVDACRYDIFEMNNEIEGELQKVISAGSHTNEFLENNFADGTHYDIVYVTATPRVADADLANRFYKVENVWCTDWDDELGTVPPERVAKRVKEAEEENPEKRLIAHFVQPHYPFIGEKGRRLQDRIQARSGLNNEAEAELSVWDHLGEGNVMAEEVWDAYEENLKEVISLVKDLVESLVGRTVVTSDHGNAFGEMGIYGHPGKKYLPELVHVPWLVVDDDNRKSVSEGNSLEADTNVDKDKVMKRLLDLGYK